MIFFFFLQCKTTVASKMPYYGMTICVFGAVFCKRDQTNMHVLLKVKCPCMFRVFISFPAFFSFSFISTRDAF